MEVTLQDLKLNKIRQTLTFKDNNDNLKKIEIFNVIGHERDILLEKLHSMVDDLSEVEFEECWYKYLIENYTNIKGNDLKIRELLEYPTYEFLCLKRELDSIVNEVYLDMVLNQLTQLENERISLEIELVKQRVEELKQLKREIEEK